MTNPAGYGEMTPSQMSSFLLKFSAEMQTEITEDSIQSTIKEIFKMMNKNSLKLDTARDYFALMRRNHSSFEKFIKNFK